MTPSGIEIEIFQRVAQCLDQLRHHVLAKLLGPLETGKDRPSYQVSDSSKPSSQDRCRMM